MNELKNNPNTPKESHMRFRNVFMIYGGLLTILLYIITDPNNGIIENLPFGASTVVLLATLLKSIWFIGMLHCGRRALLDYVDLKSVLKTAVETPDGAGKAAIAIAIIMVAIAIVIAAAVMSN